MAAEIRYGVRRLGPVEERRGARLGGFFFLVYALTVLMVRYGTGDLILRSDLPSWLGLDIHAWMGVVAGVMGLVGVIVGFVASDSTILRWSAPLAVIGFLYSAGSLPVIMWTTNYPISGLVVISYAIIAILAFYLLARWAALAVAGLLVAGQWWLDSVSNPPWPLWFGPTFIALVVLAAGYFVGLLMQQLEHSRDELADLNANLEVKVAEQVGEVERLGRLRRFLSAPVAEAVLSSDVAGVLAPHRREIAVMFCDLRGFTSFTKRVEPEEVIEVLDAYYAAAGEQITQFQATLGSFEGDGLMAYLNDPNPCKDPAKRIVDMGVAIANAIDELTPIWSSRGFDLSYGIGMAFGHATLGAVGFDGRSDYTALGTVVNLGARLCSTANSRELIVDHRIFLEAQGTYGLTALEPRELKGFAEPVPAYLVDRP